MTGTLLLVTWIVSGQALSSYQVQFSSAEACEAARMALIGDAERVSNQLLLPHGTPAPPAGYKVDSDRTPLAISAICVSPGSN
jgi:hypothetical protein